MPDNAERPWLVSFPKGHRYSLRENMSVESHRRRMMGLYKAWGVKDRINRGERVMRAPHKAAIKRAKRVRLRENIAAEARHIQNIARQNAVESMEILADIARDEGQNAASRIAAIALTLERAYGKATQTNVTANIDANGKPTEVTSKELDTRIAETLKRVESLTGGEAQAEASESGPADVCVSDRDPGGSSIH